MVRAWYIEGTALKNPRAENHKMPPKFVALEELHRLTGAEYYQLESDAGLENLKKERGYNYEDELTTPIGEMDLKKFYTEHFHAEEEIRWIVEGCAYFDLKDVKDEWVRVEVMPGDLIVVPAGCYHRFTLDHTNSVKMKRLFLKDPVYKSYARPEGDNMDCRKAYLQKIQENL